MIKKIFNNNYIKKKEFKYIFLLFLFSILISFYCFEIYKHYSKKNYIKKSIIKNSKLDLISNNLENNIDTVSFISPSKIFKINQVDIYPLSGISNILTINCNENGYWSKYVSDKFGFNNNNNSWDNKNIDILFIGDSFIHGSCVNNDDNIPNNYKKISNKKVLNLGISGSGPLTQLAILKEYGDLIYPEKIFWFFYEGNDFSELNLELQNKILKKYFNKNYIQELIKKNLIINSELKKYFEKKLIIEKNNIKKNVNFKKNNLYEIKLILKLTETRQLLEKFFNIKLITRKNYLNNKNLNYFKKIVKNFKTISKNKNAELYFVYLPSKKRLLSPKSKSNTILNKKLILDILKKENIFIIDLTNLFKKYSKNEIKLLYPNDESHIHFNENGYKIITEYIIKRN